MYKRAFFRNVPATWPRAGLFVWQAIAEAVANGELAASEAASVTRVVEVFVKAFELHSFDERLTKLERNDAQLPHAPTVPKHPLNPEAANPF